MPSLHARLFASMLSIMGLAGCLDVEPPDGVLACTTVDDCPDETWTCRDMRCFRGADEDGGTSDAGDAPGMDAPFDASGLDVPDFDGGLDTGAIDGGDASDGGPSDGGMSDGGMPDAGPECFTATDCPPSPSFCMVAACDAGTCTVAARDCDDGLSCTVDACDDTGAACVHNPGSSCGMGLLCDPEAMAPGSGCVDAPDCTPATVATDCPEMACSTASCPAGSCVYAPIVCTEDGDLCTNPTFCDPTTNACRYDPVTCGDDGNPCTQAGVCNASTGLCDYPDVVCPMDSNACTLAPVCNTTTGACTEPFDLSSLMNPMACGMSPGTSCTVCAASHPSREPVCSGGVCSDRCMTGRVDVDGVAANGCECTFVSAVDDQDDAAVDANCDGADGVIGGTRHIYVTPMGAGTGASPASPTNLANAIMMSTAARREILMTAGTYTVPVPLQIVSRSGLVFFGGYNASFTARPMGMRSLVTTSGANALFVRDVASLQIDSVDFSTGNQTAASAHTHTIDIINSTGVSITRSNISAGRGGAGMPGADGRDGGPGSEGARGNSGTAAGAGSGGTGAGGGGSGGNGGGVGANGRAGSAGAAPCSADGGSLGMGVSMLCLTGDGMSGSAGSPGCDGTAGTEGGGGGDRGTLAGMWMPANGMGGTLGGSGGPGGGGGGGGGVNCGANDAVGGGGGAGGTGGAGGMPGGGGGGGGASIGILLVGSQLTIDRVILTTASGGDGGAGGAAGTGGPGGVGGLGGRGFSMTSSTGGGGGPGGDGGAGGRGGCGGGGGGGPSVGIYGDGAAAMVHVVTTVSYSHAAGGAGGAPCSGGSRMGMSGASVDTIGVTPF